jgi:hypothetical protein
MQPIEIIAIIAFVILLMSSIFMLTQFYICDHENCKAFNQAEKKAPKGTKEYVIVLLNELYNDGIWPIPYIGASILTPLSLWFIGVPINVRNFAILFFVSFVVIYFMFTFFGHHYIKFISAYTSDYIRESCPNSEELNPPQSDIILNHNDGKEDKDIPGKSFFPSFTDGLCITFSDSTGLS